uniref:Peptidase S1 domain-containing protein n=1 Tax=Romanomermis culicivorax TaxID=13658 RepID=A0A915JYJ9_ROMCU
MVYYLVLVDKRNHSIDPTAIIAHFGVHNPYTAEEWVESIRAKAVSIHESYNPEPLSHDIAIIRLSKAIKFSELVQPLNITSLNLTSISNCSISGWGADKNKKCNYE